MSRMLHAALIALTATSGCAADDDDHHVTGDPAAPYARGTIDLAPNIDQGTYALLKTGLYAASGEPRASFGVVELPTTFPTRFSVGGGLGTGPSGEYTVRAWLAHSVAETTPSPGAPFAETTVFISCGPSCNGPLDVTLRLEMP